MAIFYLPTDCYDCYAILISDFNLVDTRNAEIVLGAGHEGHEHSDEKRECNSDEENSEGERKPKKGSLKKRAVNAGYKFRHSLRRKSKTKNDNHVASIEDIRDVQELETVERFRQCLLDEGLLPEHHDDYHTMLRYCCIAFAHLKFLGSSLLSGFYFLHNIFYMKKSHE
jgi:hypothetical protein